MFKSRKQLRKEKRKEKKVRRANRYVNVNLNANSTVKQTTAKNIANNKKSINHKDNNDRILLEHERSIKQLGKLKKDMNRQRIKQLMEANEVEDQFIKSLEKKLKMDKRRTKSLPKAFKDEGLDYILELCEFNNVKIPQLEQRNEIMKFAREDDNIKSDEIPEEYTSHKNPESIKSNNDRMKRLQSMVDKHVNKKRKLNLTDEYVEENINDGADVSNDFDEPEDSEDNDDLDSNDESDTREEINNDDHDSNDVDNQYDDSNDHDDKSSDQDNESSDQDNESSDQGDENSKKSILRNDKKKNTNYWEDIYGRTRDTAGNIVQTPSGKYVPPHRKFINNNDVESADVIRLSKQMKGLLNKLTQSNMHSISRQIEDLYMSYSHNDVNKTLISLLTSSLITKILSPESIVMEHAMLIALLHANVGDEVGSYVLQHFVENLAKMLDENNEVEDKTIDNTLFFVCHLYNFKVFDCVLLFDILKKLGNTFTEKDIDLILLTLRTVGFVLRKDNPQSLKELIITLQTKARDSEYHKSNERVKFMLDTLLAIKNNNMTKIPQYDPTKIEQLKKVIKPMIRTGHHLAELKITLDDILNVETRGRWWIVGSAWHDDKRFKTNPNNDQDEKQLTFSKEILKLAQRQRMNTDARRNIFCILVTAEDYLDAFEKLMKLDLKGSQHREIVHVLIHCFLREKRYNPYYVYLAEHLCSANRIYQLAIQFAMWDRFKEINSLSSLQISHVSKFLSYLFLESRLSISILKVIQFTEMDQPLLKLIRSILLNVLLSESDEKLVNVFYSISKSPSLNSLRQSLQVFFHHFILKNIDVDDLINADQIQSLPKKVMLAEKAMFKFTNEFD